MFVLCWALRLEKNWMLGQNVDNAFQRIIYIWLHFSNIALIVNVKRSDFYEMSWWCVRSIAKVCTHYFVILPQAHIIIPITWCLLYFPDHMSRQVTRGPGQSLSLVWVSPRPLIGHCTLSQVCFAKISGLISYWGPSLVPYWLANTVLSTLWPLQPVVSAPGLLLAVISISRSPIGWLAHRHKCLTKCIAHVPSAAPLLRAWRGDYLSTSDLYQEK